MIEAFHREVITQALCYENQVTKSTQAGYKEVQVR